MTSKNKKNLFICFIAILFLAIVAICGYFFANLKNKPAYVSPIDKIMFDTKNKPPKYLLTLADRKILDNVQQKILLTKDENKDALEAFELIQQIPNFNRVPHVKNKMPLAVVEKIEGVKEPWTVYAKNVVVPQGFNKVAVIIKSFGLDQKTVDQLLSILPENVSLSFSPYTYNLEDNVLKARESGHETYVDLLLSPNNVLEQDNGPLALSITSSVEENINKIKTIVDKKIAIGGFVTSRGMADEETTKRLSNVLDYLELNSLLFVDACGDVAFDRINTKTLPRKKADVVIDRNFSKKNIKENLLEAEMQALKHGSVIIVIEPKPIAIIELLNWVNTFSKPINDENSTTYVEQKKPFILVPLSEVVIE